MTAADVPQLKPGAVLANAGTSRGRSRRRRYGGAVPPSSTGGHMVNLAGPRPLGNSIESMDIGFALQARCLEAVATGAVGAGVVRRARAARIDEQVASQFVAIA